MRKLKAQLKKYNLEKDSLEKHTLQKYSLEKYTLEKNSWEKYTFENQNLKAFRKYITSRGLLTLCNNPETPTQLKSDCVTGGPMDSPGYIRGTSNKLVKLRRFVSQVCTL